MSAEVNKTITGEYDHVGKAVIYGDTDSCEGTSLIETSQGVLTIEELFDMCEDKTNDKDKEYAIDENIMVMSYDIAKNEPYMGHINYVYRHKVEKDMYEIEDSNGNTVTVTEDHSIMVEREGRLIEVKPVDIDVNDIILTLSIK
jgi:intein/homing endonuclease